MPDEPNAVVLKAATFDQGDASDALQAAIDRVQHTTRRGVVFIPSGHYRITHTIAIWSGIRLVGYGTTRPLLELPPNTDGFHDTTRRYLLQFSGERPESSTAAPPNANSSTFHSGMMNVDIVLGDGNPDAVAIRFHVAQHGLLSHVDVDAGNSFAALEDAGGTLTDVSFHRGHFGIFTHQTSPGWPFLVMDSSFAEQTEAAVRLYEVQGIFVRDRIEKTPVAFWLESSKPVSLSADSLTLRNISFAALRPTGSTAENLSLALRNIDADDVPVFALQPKAAEHDGLLERKAVARLYRVERFNAGIHVRSQSQPDSIVEQTWEAHVLSAPPSPKKSTVPALPADSTWVSVRTFGAAGDGSTDDTAALQRAIDSGKPLYLPRGRYRIDRPLQLRRDSVLIGLNPITSVIVLNDSATAFTGPTTRAMVETTRGCSNILSGVGLETGGLIASAAALLWRCGEQSLVDDLRILGGHGTALPDGSYRATYNEKHTADPDPRREWNREPASILVRGGGGTFRNIWSPNTYAKSALDVADSRLPTQVYMLSAEHHLEHEVVLHNVSRWSFVGLQTESERADGAHALPLLITDGRDLRFDTAIFYRVSRSTASAPTAVQLNGCDRCSFFNISNASGSPYPFDATIVTARPKDVIASHRFNWWQTP
ncbi:glycoside hydrolase family 55 protein [Granulicella cerasi]|uniref:Glycoside hydrolase family 55 protein n=1 Tax=Granulicella cerasi TaxID=741063 RepID=A0ABW1Z614_9BACT|nr:glycoside hydrolase family 55 protein [Granulicella cerasi]